jgi:glycosyltransferase involved in cell wall biosynthesis
MSKILVYTGVYNEVAFIERTIRSVLNQSHVDFDFFISDNHSTDGSAELIRRFASADSRIKVISPPSFLSSLDHGQFIVSSVRGRDYVAALYIGGHDLISPDYLAVMYKWLIQNPSCAIVYPKNAFEVDSNDQILKQWGSSPQTLGVPQPFRAICALLTLVQNIPLFGLWRYEVFNSCGELPRCMGGDHFFVARALLSGDLLEVPEGSLYLRRAEGADDLGTYKKKHLGNAVNGADDLMAQLRYLTELVNRSCIGYPDSTVDAVRASAALLYTLRFNHLLTTPEEREQFFSQPKVNAAFGACIQAGGLLRELLGGGGLDGLER